MCQHVPLTAWQSASNLITDVRRFSLLVLRLCLWILWQKGETEILYPTAKKSSAKTTGTTKQNILKRYQASRNWPFPSFAAWNSAVSSWRSTFWGSNPCCFTSSWVIWPRWVEVGGLKNFGCYKIATFPLNKIMGIPKQSSTFHNVSVFFHVVHHFWVKMNDKNSLKRSWKIQHPKNIRQLPSSKAKHPSQQQAFKSLLWTGMLRSFKEKRSIIHGHLRGGETSYKLPPVADDCCCIFVADLWCPCPILYLFAVHRFIPKFSSVFFMFFTHIQTLSSSVGIVGRGLPRCRKQCAIISNLVPITQHACNKPTNLPETVPKSWGWPSLWQVVANVSCEWEDHLNTGQTDQSSDAKPANADSRHICQSWHLKTYNLHLENSLRI